MLCLANFPHLAEYLHIPFLSISSGLAVGFMAAAAHSRGDCARAVQATILFCTRRCCLQVCRVLVLDVYQVMPQITEEQAGRDLKDPLVQLFLAKAQSRQDPLSSGPCAIESESSKDGDPMASLSHGPVSDTDYSSPDKQSKLALIVSKTCTLCLFSNPNEV